MKDFKSIENDLSIERNKKWMLLTSEVRNAPYPFNWIIFTYKYSPVESDRKMYEKLNSHFEECEYEKLIDGFDKILNFIKYNDRRWKYTDRNIDMFSKVFKRKMTYTSIANEYGLSNNHVAHIIHHVSKALESPKYKYMMLGVCNSSITPDKLTDNETIFDLFISELSVRAKNCINRAGVFTVENLTALSVADFACIRNFGKCTMDEVLTSMERYNLTPRKQKPGDRHYLGERGTAHLIKLYEDVIIKHFGSIDNI